MALQTLNTIKQWFRTGLKPTQTQFWDTWDSFRHKFEKIPVKDIDGIDELLLSKADKTVLDNHLADKSAHAPQVNTDWNSESGFSQLLNKPKFRTVNGQTILGTGDIAITTESADLQSVLDNGSYAKLENKTVQIYNHGANPLDYSQSTSHPNFIQITNMKNNNSGRFEVGRGFANIVQSTAEGNTTTVEFENNFSETGNKVNMKFPSKPTGDYTLSTTSDFKTINGESIIGEGNLDIEPQGLKSVLDADPTASYGQSKATLMGDYGTSKYNELIVSDETEKTGIYQLKNQLSFDHTVLDSNDIGNITLSEGNIKLTRDKSNNQTVVDISDPVANTQLRFPAKSEEGKTYTIATTDDFKTINGESIVGSGDILINGGDGNIPTLQEVLDKDRNATNASINLLSEDGESQTTVHEGGLNISEKTETGFLITDINKLGVSVSKDEETTFANISADELSLNKHLSGNPVKQGIVLNEDSSGASKIKLPLTSDGDVKILAATEDFKTINGESIVGEGDITIEGGTTPDATTEIKGIVKLAGDLGGTADLPTTPTAIHITGNENFTGIKSSLRNEDSLESGIALINDFENGEVLRIENKKTGVGQIVVNSGTGKGIEVSNSLEGDAIVVNGAQTATGFNFVGQNDGSNTFTVDKLGNGIFSGNVSGATPTTANHLITKAYADNLVVGMLNLRGSFDASSNLYPTTGGSGTAGAIRKGDLWYISVAGTLSGKAVNIGDSFITLSDAPGQTFANWNVMESNIGYVPANDASVVHKTGDETKSGYFQVIGGILSDGSDNNRAGFTAKSVNQAGFQCDVTGSGTGINASVFSGTAASFRTQTGVGLYVRGEAGNADLAQFYKGSAIKAHIDADGIVRGVGGYFLGLGILTSNASGAGLEVRNGDSNTSNLAVFGQTTIQRARINYLGDIFGNSFVKSGGSSNQFLKADGSIDVTNYAIDSNVLHKTGNETKNGQLRIETENISGLISIISGTGNALIGSAVSGIAVDGSSDSGLGGNFVSGSGTALRAIVSTGSKIAQFYQNNTEKSYINSALGTLVIAGGTQLQIPRANGSLAAVTKGEVGLANVDNTSDVNKPISTAVQAALNAKQDNLTNPITGTLTANIIPKAVGGGGLVNSTFSEVAGSGFINGDFYINPFAGGKLTFQKSTTPFGLIGSTSRITGSGSDIDLNVNVYGNNPFGIWTNGVKRITVGGDGNVGVGTIPLNQGGAAKWLAIDGTGFYGGGLVSSINGVSKASYYYESGFAKVQGETGSGVKLIVNGNVDALTILPSGNTTINGSAGADVLTLVKSTGASIALNGATGATESVKLIADNSLNPDFLAYVGGSERLRIKANNGNVGIGVVTPNSKLEVNDQSNSFSGFFRGNGRTNGVAFGTDSSNNAIIQGFGPLYNNLHLQPYGNDVLIGTTTSNGSKLQVNGTGYFKNGIKLGANSNSPVSNSSWIQAEDDSVSIFLTNASVSQYAGLQANGNFITSGNAVIQGTISANGISNPYQFKTDLEAFNETPLSSNRTIATEGVVIPSVGSGFGFLESFKYQDANYGMQRFTFFTSSNEGKMYVRIRNAGTWSAWVEK